MSEKVRITPEIQKDLYGWLCKEADSQTRTLHGQVAHILQSYRVRAESGIPVIGRGAVAAIQRGE